MGVLRGLVSAYSQNEGSGYVTEPSAPVQAARRLTAIRPKRPANSMRRLGFDFGWSLASSPLPAS